MSIEGLTAIHGCLEGRLGINHYLVRQVFHQNLIREAFVVKLGFLGKIWSHVR